MRSNTGKQRSFLFSFTWVGIMLLLMGLLFLGIAAVMQLVPIDPRSLNLYVNGVRQPPTEESARTFRLIFLLTFGIIGLALAIAGGFVAERFGRQRRLARRLKEEGVRVTAEAMEYSASNFRLNRRSVMRLLCSYTGFDGRTYIFKSGLLRMNPMPYLYQGQINVYYDRDNMSRYFVDVDGSVGAELIEL